MSVAVHTICTMKGAVQETQQGGLQILLAAGSVSHHENIDVIRTGGKAVPAIWGNVLELNS